MVDTLVSGASASRRVGSTPISGTKAQSQDWAFFIIFAFVIVNTMKIAFLDAATMGDVSFEPIARLGEFITYPGSTPQQARERVRDLDVLIINKILVDKAENIIILFTVHRDFIDQFDKPTDSLSLCRSTIPQL